MEEKIKEILKELDFKIVRLANETLNKLFDLSYESLEKEILERDMKDLEGLKNVALVFELRAHQTYIAFLTYLSALYSKVFEEFKAQLVKKLNEI